MVEEHHCSAQIVSGSSGFLHPLEPFRSELRIIWKQMVWAKWVVAGWRNSLNQEVLGCISGSQYVFVRWQWIPRGCASDMRGDLEEQYLHIKSLVLPLRPVGMSDAKGPIWDSVSQGWSSNCQALGNCLYKEHTLLVHQKVKGKRNLYQCSMYFFYKGLAHHHSWLFLILLMLLQAVQLELECSWPRVSVQRLLSGPLRDRPSARCICFFSCLSSLNKNVMLWECPFHPIASLHQSCHFLTNCFRKLYLASGCLLNSSIVAACPWNPNLFVCKLRCSSVQSIL